MSLIGASPTAIKQLIDGLIRQREEAREEARSLRELLTAQTSPDDIAAIDRAVGARILDLRRRATLTGDAMTDDEWQEMDLVTRAWERVRYQLGKR